MEVKQALLCLHSKIPSLVFCAFNHKIVFGPLSNDSFEESRSFLFNHYEYHKLFIGLYEIIKTLSGNSTNVNGILLKRANEVYTWECIVNENNKVLKLSINNGQSTTYEIVLNTIEFNDVPRLIGFLMLPSLKLKPAFFEIFYFFSQMDLNVLLTLKKISQIQILIADYVKQNNLDFSYFDRFSCSTLLDYHLDVIIATNKILSFFNDKLCSTQENITAMENC